MDFSPEQESDPPLGATSLDRLSGDGVTSLKPGQQQEMTFGVAIPADSGAGPVRHRT